MNIKIEEEAVPIVAARINMVEEEVVVVAVIWPEIIVHKNGRHSHLTKERDYSKQEREVIIIEVGVGTILRWL